MKKLSILFALLVSVTAFSQTRVDKYTAGSNLGTTTYYLPKTAIKVTLHITKTSYTPGDLYNYANHYLRLKDVSGTPSVHWTLNTIELTSVGVPDANKIYTIEVRNKTVAPLLELTKNGIILSINKTSEIVPTATEAEHNWKKKKKLDARDFLTEEILRTGSTAKMAELIAKEIYEIRDTRNSILRGQAENMPQDGNALKIILASLKEQEEALKELFSGSTTQEETTESFTVVPTKNIQHETLFRFSTHFGLVDADDLSGDPYFISVVDLKTVPPLSAEAIAERAKKKIEGVIYNVPGLAKVTIADSRKELLSKNVPIAQFGNEETLGDKLFDKNATTRVTFDPTTGGLLNLEKE